MEIKALCIKIPKNVGLKLRFNSRTKVMKTTKVKLLKLAFKNPFCNNFLELTRQCDSNSVLGLLNGNGDKSANAFELFFHGRDRR